MIPTACQYFLDLKIIASLFFVVVANFRRPLVSADTFRACLDSNVPFFGILHTNFLKKSRRGLGGASEAECWVLGAQATYLNHLHTFESDIRCHLLWMT